jgi:23S rRNA (cytosine1962-C5)-methyltransferase
MHADIKVNSPMADPKTAFSSIQIDYCQWDAYELLDSGHGRKLERFGTHTLIRDEPKAWWAPSLPEAVWKAADGVHHEKRWKLQPSTPAEWEMGFEGLKLSAKFFNTSKHIGVFPEQSSHWRWIKQQCAKDKPSILSLFGYTGVATLVAAQAGASVTHVDASRPALTWARTNQALSGLQEAPIRWILDDAQKFLQREIRRGKRYDALILDPPSFGRGPDNESWYIEKDLVALLENCKQLLTPKPSFIVLTLYALEASSLMIGGLLQEMMKGYAGSVEIGELAHLPKHGHHPLPLSIYGRWLAKG